jgi:hypothetical protein
VPPVIVPLSVTLAPLRINCESVVIVGMIVATWKAELALVVWFVVAKKSPPVIMGENDMPKGPVAAPTEVVEAKVNAPVDVFTVYTETLLVAKFDTAAYKLPFTNGENATAEGPVPVVNGDPATAVGTPVLVFIEYTETKLPVLLEPLLLFCVTARNKLPLMTGEKAIPVGIVFAPMLKGDPVAAVNMPVEVFTEKIAKSPVPPFAAAANKLPFTIGEKVKPRGWEPAGPVVGLAIVVSAPVTVFIEYTVRTFEPLFATPTNTLPFTKGENAVSQGLDTAENGDPETCVREPVAGLT